MIAPLRPTPTTLVVRVHPYAGFFACVNCVANHLCHTLGRRGVSAVRVDWQLTPDFRYFPYGAPADGNLWDRFFEPLAFPSFPDKEIVTDTFSKPLMTDVRAYLHIYKLGRYRRRYHRAYRDYIRLRPHLQARVEALASRFSGRYCVGVHYRNQHHSIECPEPIPPVAEFIRRTRELIAGHPGAGIFLATDVEAAVRQYTAAFGDRVIHQAGVPRAGEESDDHYHHLRQGSIGLGEDVAIDCYVLARCDALLHVTSNIATAAACLNPDLRLVYCERSAWRGLARYPLVRMQSRLRQWAWMKRQWIRRRRRVASL
jgi:hypothetical protein